LEVPKTGLTSAGLLGAGWLAGWLAGSTIQLNRAWMEGGIQVGAREVDHAVQAGRGRPGRVQEGEGQVRGWPKRTPSCLGRGAGRDVPVRSRFWAMARCVAGACTRASAGGTGINIAKTMESCLGIERGFGNRQRCVIRDNYKDDAMTPKLKRRVECLIQTDGYDIIMYSNHDTGTFFQQMNHGILHPSWTIHSHACMPLCDTTAHVTMAQSVRYLKVRVLVRVYHSAIRIVKTPVLERVRVEWLFGNTNM
jgi:hypothetical protein